MRIIQLYRGKYLYIERDNKSKEIEISREGEKERKREKTRDRKTIRKRKGETERDMCCVCMFWCENVCG